MQAVSYSNSQSEVWDAFVRTSRNATFLHVRSYMDYHSDRFADASLLFYDEKCRLQGLLPANVDLSTQTAWSHQGLTYGGLLLADDTRYETVREMLDAACLHYKKMGLQHFVYKCIPAIYSRYHSEEDLYWLYRKGATLTARSLSSCITLDGALPFSTLRGRKLHAAERAGLTVSVSEEWGDFWELLSGVLRDRHGVRPVHTLGEITLLHSRFPGQIVLYAVKDSGAMLGGCVVYDTGRVAHVQYIAASEAGRKVGALDLLFYDVIQTYKDRGVPYFDFGISTESGGTVLNEGLLFQKEGFGGRGVVYDTYHIAL